MIQFQAKAPIQTPPAARQPEFAALPELPRPVATPQFGNALVGAKLMAADKATSVFKNIVEIFLWAFLAQDILAMCLVRMIVSLKRGRIPYDPNQDPNAKDRPIGDQVRLWLQKNVQGLNWPNFAEESMRELATGPGVLAIPALGFGIARRTFGKGAVELGYGPLTQMGHGFMDQLAKLPESHILNESLTAGQLADRIKDSGQSAEKFLAQRQQEMRRAYQGEFQKFLKGLFADQAMLYGDEAAKAPRALDAPIRKRIAELRTDFAKQFGKTAPEAPKTFVELIDQFAERYTDAVFAQGDDKLAKQRAQVLEALGQEVDEAIVKGYNQSARLANNPGNFYRAMDTLVRLPVVSKGRVTGMEATAKPVSALMHDLHRFKDLVVELGETKIVGAGGRGYLEKTADIGRKMIRKLISKKMMLSAGTILVTALYLKVLARLVQRGESYPGEREAHAAAPPKPQPVPLQVSQPGVRA